MVFERVNASKAENINFETCVVTDHQKVKKESTLLVEMYAWSRM